ncbi:MAG: hypothetical protein QM679_12465 [Patulibacter sp.]
MTSDELPRNPVREREIHLALDAGPHARALSTLAGERALPGPVLLPPGRCLLQELAEELADGLNYTAWAAMNGDLDKSIAAEVCALISRAHALVSTGVTIA